jgi:hypothetical protein
VRPAPARHVLQQGSVLAALGRTAFMALRQDRKGQSEPPAVPGPEFSLTRPALPRPLIDDYLRHLGSDAKSYRGEVPPHLFPQWCFPAFARTFESLPYPLLKIVNGGCDVEVLAPLPDSEPISVRAWLHAIEDDGSKAVLRLRAVTGTTSVPEALRVELTAIVPLGGARKSSSPNGSTGQKKSERPRVADGAHEVLREYLPADTGLSFAKLTGDFNPIHWLPVYAKASGFNNVILHGFGTLARAWEALVRNQLAGDTHAISRLQARFTRPLVLPHEVGVYATPEKDLFVGDAPGGPAYLTGRYETK